MEAAEARLSLHLSKCHIVGNHMSQLKFCLFQDAFSAYEQKVCVKDFPAEQTKWPYYLARDTAELLIRFTKYVWLYY